MTTQDKKDKIKSHVVDMLNFNHESMLSKVDSVLSSGSLDIDGWDEASNSLILPKCIVMALLEQSTTQFDARGTSYEKFVKKEVRNIRCFL